MTAETAHEAQTATDEEFLYAVDQVLGSSARAQLARRLALAEFGAEWLKECDVSPSQAIRDGDSRQRRD